MAKILNTGHPLYNNIVRALSADEYKQEMLALDGKSSVSQQGNNCRVESTGLTFTAQQGIAFDGTHWFGSSGGAGLKLEKYDTSSNVITTNNNPYLNLPVGTDHIGDICVDENYLYAVCDNYSGGTATVGSLVRFNKSDLTYHSHWDIQESGKNTSGICISSDGTELLVTAFEPSADLTTVRATEVRRYGITDGIKIGSHTLNQGVRGIQGITYGDNHYFLSSFGSKKEVVAFDSEFNFVASYDPVFNTAEMEGVEFHNDTLYFHTIDGVPQKLLYNQNMYISTTTTESQPVKFLDSVDYKDDSTVLMRFTPNTIFNFSTIFDNLVSGNDTEAWIYADGRLAFRIDVNQKVEFTPIVAGNEYIVAFTWSKSGSNVTLKLGVNGTYGTANSSGLWKSARDLYLGGINSANDQADTVFKDVIVYNKVLSDAELSDVSTNFDTIYTIANLPIGSITIGTITKDATTASIPFTYDNTDETGYECRLDNGTATSTTSPINLTGLTPETEYTIEVRAVNNDGAGAWSNPSTFTTDAVSSTLSISITNNIPDGTYNTVIMNDSFTTEFVGTVTYTSGSASIANINKPVGTKLTGYLIDNQDPPIEGAVITGTTV